MIFYFFHFRRHFEEVKKNEMACTLVFSQRTFFLLQIKVFSTEEDLTADTPEEGIVAYVQSEGTLYVGGSSWMAVDLGQS